MGDPRLTRALNGIRIRDEPGRRTHHKARRDLGFGSDAGLGQSITALNSLAERQAWKPQIRIRTCTIPRDLMAEPADMFLKRVVEANVRFGSKADSRGSCKHTSSTLAQL